MPNIATVLKDEIARLARKELRSGIDTTHRAITSHRKQLAELKRRLQALERELILLRKQQAKPAKTEPLGERSTLRFRPQGLAAHRQRLGLSAREVGQLIGTSSLSVYNWERGKSRPRARHLEAIAALRKMGKREVAQKLANLSD